jgi:signal transduction histidine kinase
MHSSQAAKPLAKILAKTHKRYMAERIVKFLVLIAVIFCPLQFLAARMVHVGIAQNPPKCYIDDEGKPAGIFVEILNSIGNEEGWELQYQLGKWDENLHKLQSGEIDLVADVAYTTDRDKLFSFHSIPVLSSWSQVYSRKGLGIQSIIDLDGKRIVVLEGSIQQQALNTMVKGFGLQVTITAVQSFDDAFKAVAENKADVAVTNNFFGRMHANSYGLEDTAIVFEPSTLFFVAAKGRNLDLLDKIDANLKQLKQTPDSDYYKAIRNWTSESTGMIIPLWVKVMLLVIGLGLLISTIAGFVLKRQVRLRTHELQLANADMESRIMERTKELATAMQAAQQADMLKSAFLATMSHELRTPLNSIIGFTGILLQELPGNLNDEQKKQLHLVQNSSRHLLSLINDVLDISKIEAGQLDLQYSNFDLTKSIDKAVSLVKTQAEKKGLEISTCYQHNSLEIECDQRRLEQVILNLLSNAVKFTETGSITINTMEQNECFIISIQDTGIGIPLSELDRLFKPFHQIDSGLTRKYEGTGLGLSICYQLLNLLGGRIVVKSEPGKGSTFRAIVPKRRANGQKQTDSCD